LNTGDADVVKFLKYFTFLSRESIADLERATADAPERREAPRVLAREVTALVHGDAAMKEAEAIGAAMFGGDVAALTAAQLGQVCRAIPTAEIGADEAGGPGGVGAGGAVRAAQLGQVCRAIPTAEIGADEAGALGVVDLLVRVGAADSKGEARKLLAGGGVPINGQRVTGVADTLRSVGSLHERFWIVRKGRRAYYAGRLSARGRGR